MASVRRFSPKLYEFKWAIVRLCSELLQPYRNTRGLRHRCISAAFETLLRTTEYANPEDIRELQLIRLKKMLRLAERVPWWQSRFRTAGLDWRTISRIGELERLPVVSKRSFPLDIPRTDFLTRPLSNKRLMLRRTSGTTGMPFEWGMDVNTLLVETNAYFLRAVRWYDPTLCRRGRGLFVATPIFGAYGVPKLFIHWNPVGEAADAEARRLIRQIQREAPSVLFSYPTNALLFAKKIAELRETVPIKLVLTVGQKLDDDARELIERYLRCPVASVYGTREFGMNASECPRRRHWYHLNAERLYTEITNEEGCIVPDGEEGFITVTSLENRAMPLFRYQLDDRGRMISGTCPCGRTLPLIQVVGKTMDFIHLRNGRRIPFRHINIPIILRFFDEIQFYQIQQTTLDTIVIRLKLRRSDDQGFEDRFLPEIKRVIDNHLEVVFEYPEEWSVDMNRKMKIFVPLDVG